MENYKRSRSGTEDRSRGLLDKLIYTEPYSESSMEAHGTVNVFTTMLTLNEQIKQHFDFAFQQAIFAECEWAFLLQSR